MPFLRFVVLLVAAGLLVLAIGLLLRRSGILRPAVPPAPLPNFFVEEQLPAAPY